MTAPCWHCPNMRLGCHGTCEAYKAYDAQQQALRESAPMFVPANRACMVFQHKGMAEKTAEKIEAWCPVDFAGKLHVMPFEEVLDDVEG